MSALQRFTILGLSLLICSGCGSGLDTSVCGIPYGKNEVGVTVPAASVVPLDSAGVPIADPGSAGYALVNDETWVLVAGKFSAAHDTQCTFDVRERQVIR